MSINLPGFSVQLLVSLSAPIQSFPHFDGGGLVQVLVRVWCPSPHVLLHDENFDHCVYLPSVDPIMVVKSKDNRVGSFKKTCFSFSDKTTYEIFEKKDLIVILEAEMIDSTRFLCKLPSNTGWMRGTTQ